MLYDELSFICLQQIDLRHNYYINTFDIIYANLCRNRIACNVNE